MNSGHAKSVYVVHVYVHRPNKVQLRRSPSKISLEHHLFSYEPICDNPPLFLQEDRSHGALFCSQLHIRNSSSRTEEGEEEEVQRAPRR